MKTAKLVISLAVAFSLQPPAFATEPAASGSGAVSTWTSARGNFALGSNGSATSFSQNSQSASAGITATTSATPHYRNVSAAVGGTAATASSGRAYNISTGTGSGTATSAGAASSGVQGMANIHGVSVMPAAGAAQSEMHSRIVAGTNQGSYFAGETTSGFDVQVNYARQAPSPAAGVSGYSSAAGASLASQSSGYASGANISAALEGMNSAGIVNIGASGRYFAGSGTASSSRAVSAR